MYCHNCGAYNDDTTSKCENCGEPFQNSDGVNPFFVGVESTMNDAYHQPAVRRSFISAARTCLVTWTPKGRASRSEFWYWILFVVLAVGAPFILALWLDNKFWYFSLKLWDIDVAEEIGYASLIMGAICILPTLFVTIRRLHDIGKSVTSLFWVIVPYVLLAALGILHDASGDLLGAPFDQIVFLLLAAIMVLGLIYLPIILCRPGKKNGIDVKTLRRRAVRKRKRAAETPTATHAENAYCRHCGALNAGNAVVCAHCGKSVTEAPEELVSVVSPEPDANDELAPARERSFGDAIWACWNNWSFLGRSSRSEFWYWIALQAVIVASYCGAFCGAKFLDDLVSRTSWSFLLTIYVGFRRITLIVCMIFLIPTIAVVSRRLHDAGWLATPFLLGVPLLPIGSASFNALGRYNAASVIFWVWLVVLIVFIVLCVKPGKIDKFYEAEQSSRLNEGKESDA